MIGKLSELAIGQIIPGAGPFRESMKRIVVHRTIVCPSPSVTAPPCHLPRKGEGNSIVPNRSILKAASMTQDDKMPARAQSMLNRLLIQSPEKPGPLA
jgi:hypothetical protein